MNLASAAFTASMREISFPSSVLMSLSVMLAERSTARTKLWPLVVTCSSGRVCTGLAAATTSAANVRNAAMNTDLEPLLTFLLRSGMVGTRRGVSLRLPDGRR